MDNLSAGITLMVTGMVVLFVFMGLMILIVHYFQIIARKFEKKA